MMVLLAVILVQAATAGTIVFALVREHVVHKARMRYIEGAQDFTPLDRVTSQAMRWDLTRWTVDAFVRQLEEEAAK